VKKMAKEKQLMHFAEENLGSPFKDDITVNVTVSGIPSRLLKEFMQRVVNEQYPGGISPAIKDLMWLAVQKSKERQVKLGV
jgi:hypothetical protein